MAPQGLICPKMEKYGDISVKKCDFIEVYPRFLVHSTKNLYKEKTGTRAGIWEKSVNILRKRHQTENLKSSLISQNEFEWIGAGARRFPVLERKGGMTTNLLTKIKCFLLTGEVVLHPIWGALNKPSLRIVKNEIFIFNICLYWYTSITRT